MEEHDVRPTGCPEGGMCCDEKPLTYEDLYRPFREAFKPAEQQRVGLEVERFGLQSDSLLPLQYDGPNGILTLFHEFVKRYGWVPESEYPGGPVVALERGEASLTLEPGGQFELSGSPMTDVHGIRSELGQHMFELDRISQPMGLTWLGVGFHPLASHSQLGWVPKHRYGIMRVYLSSRGSGGLDMMRRTATVQANFDFTDEKDALRKLRVGLRLSPLVSALFANGPFVEGKPFGGKSGRLKTWLDVDSDRQGLVPQMWSETASLREYIEWALDVPMFLILRKGSAVRNTGQSFRRFMQEGFAHFRPTLKDWVTHLNTLFPDVRLKRTLEVRAADSVPLAYMCALPALWTGLFYDPQALDEAERLSADWSYEQVLALRNAVPFSGLQTDFAGKPLMHAAEKVIQIARDGLVRRARLDAQGHDETVHLDAIGQLWSRGQCPADHLLEGLDLSRPDLAQEIVRRSHI